MPKSTGVIKTNHPYIMRSHKICDGSPVLAETRTRVIDVVIEYTMLGRIGECIRRIKLIVDVLSPEEMRNHIEFL